MPARDDRLFDDVVTVVRPITRGHEQWAVLEAADANGELIRMVGTTLARYAEPGLLLRVRGRWKEHPTYGWQVHARTVAPALRPPEAEPSEHALLCRIPHIGAKRAQLLIDYYGAGAIVKQVDANPRQAFLRVAGLPQRHATEAMRWWKEQRMYRRIA